MNLTGSEIMDNKKEGIFSVEEEIRLVNKGIEFEMQEMRKGKVKTKSFAEIKKKFRL